MLRVVFETPAQPNLRGGGGGSPRPLVSWGLYLALVAVVAVAFHALWSGLGVLNDDYPAVYLRIHQYFQEFRLGHLPQVFPDVVRGGGSAFPRFYPPLAYYVGAGIYGLVGDIVWAGHLTALLSVVLSAIAMAWAAQRLGVPFGVAVVAGLAYATFPYRFTNVIVRGALAESWALVWLPLVFSAAVRLAQGSGSGLALAVPICLLLVTHTGLALWALPLVMATVLASVPVRRLAWASGALVGWGAAGVALAAWYLIPLWYYLPGVRASDPVVMWATAPDFASWHVEWGKVLGLDRLAVNLRTGLPLRVPMALSIGLPSLMMPIALLMARSNTNRLVPRARRGLPLELATGMATALVLLVMVYPSTVSNWLPQPWLYLQFPYRMAGVAGMFATMATALALGRLGAPRAGAVLFAVWAFVVGGTVVFEANRPTPAKQVTQDTLLALLASRDKGLTARYEYLPKVNRPEALGPRVQAARNALQATAVRFHDSTNALQVTVQVPRPTQITFPRVAYDFLRIVDQAGRDLPVSSDDGLLAVSLPAGYQVLTVKRRIPWPTRLAVGGTLLTAVLLALVMGRRPLRRVPP